MNKNADQHTGQSNMWTQERVDNLTGRRIAIRELLDSNTKIDSAMQQDLATQFDCSIGAIYSDMRKMTGRVDRPRTQACHQVSSENSRAFRLGIPGKITTDEWQQLCAEYDNRCLKCGENKKKLLIDHVVPLSRGGAHHISNIQPLCRRCNDEKRTTTADYR